MVHIFFGSDTVAVRQKAFAYISEQTASGISATHIDADSYIPNVCMDIAHAASLFGERTLYLLDTPSNNEAFLAEVFDALEAFAQSSDIFVIIEGALLAAAKKKFAKFADTFDEITAKAETRFNAFAMADSLSAKDKKSLWLQLQEAKQNDLSSEEVIGTLWWQLKTLRLAKRTKNAAEAGMKEYPYSKAKRAIAHFQNGELERLSRSLLQLYHAGHMGEVDIELALEKWTLSL